MARFLTQLYSTFFSPSFDTYYPFTNPQHQAVSKQMAVALNHNETLVKRLVPSFPVGCRRLGPAEGFLEAFLKDNVELANGEIAAFTKKGLQTDDGTEYEADVIICATGFDVNFRPYFPIIGRNGLALNDAWKDDPAAYLAVAASGFPNFMSKFAGNQNVKLLIHPEISRFAWA